MRAALALLASCAILAGCTATATKFVTDVQVIEKPVPVPCEVQRPARPTPHVELVQLTGRPLEDLVRIWRAAEAELEERIAYEQSLEAALQACMAPP